MYKLIVLYSIQISITITQDIETIAYCVKSYCAYTKPGSFSLYVSCFNAEYWPSSLTHDSQMNFPLL